ncbi:hypothetical protein EVG20_g253 [Dentipellis fragilis]|uniref:F-box domain-containing protein n=1 Tax=Dentipellis fragilis TaxID=205917 RepID=A0A4Y9ZG50_9AGAM|nr:hypothetical protein EVG20_g253 [Dentipellis fragilis]
MTNYGISLEEIQSVNTQISDYEKTISSIETEIQDVLRQANALRVQRRYYLDLISKCRGTITLARRAPDEILAHIFEYCAASGWAKAPLVASHVCSKWRRAALAPNVWSHVYLTSESLDPLQRTQLWLSRALKSDLHVTIDAQVVDAPFLQAMDLLLEHIPQWRSLTLEARFVQQTRYLLERCTGPANQLQVVTIRAFAAALDGEVGVEELTGLREAFEHSPHLQMLHIISNGFPPALPIQISDLSMELGSFPIGSISVENMLETIADLPSLERLTLVAPINFSVSLTLPNEQRPPTQLPSLRTLILDGYPDFNEILRFIEAPALRHLHLHSTEPPLNFPHETTGTSLRYLIESSRPPLKLLEFHDIDIPHSDFVHCFFNLPLLEELRLHETEIPNEVLSVLNGPDGACPRLKRLDLRWCEQLSGKTLVDLVESRSVASDRNGHSDPIQDITVINCALVEEEDVLAMARKTTCSVVVRNLQDHCRDAAIMFATDSGFGSDIEWI